MTRIEGLPSSQGQRGTSLTKLPEQLEALRLWDGSPIPPGLRRRVLRVYAHHTFLSEQIAAGGGGRGGPPHGPGAAGIVKGGQVMGIKRSGVKGGGVFGGGI